MDAINDAWNSIDSMKIYGIPLITLLIWLAAGIVAGTVMPGRKFGGLLGELILGVLGGALGGWASKETGFSIGDHIRGVDHKIADGVGEFITALIGAAVVLILVRVLLGFVVKKASS